MRYTAVRSLIRIGFIALVATTLGCSTKHYQITLKPDGDAIERTMVCWQTGTKPLVRAASPKEELQHSELAKNNDPEKPEAAELEDFPATELQKIAVSYHASPSKKLDQKHSFSGRFTGKMPVDLDNSGTFTRWSSPFGTASLYVERFGGNDDIQSQIDGWGKVSDRLVDVTISWLETELGKEPHWSDLRTFLDVNARRDVHNLIYTVLVSAGGRNPFDPYQDKTSSDFVVEGVDFGVMWIRLLQYAIERDYLELSDIPMIARLGDSQDPKNERQFVRFIDRFIGRKLGIADDAPRPPSMAFLQSDESLTKSVEKYVRATPAFRKAEADWRERLKVDPKATQPEMNDVMWDYIAGKDWFKKELLGDAATSANNRNIEIKLECREKPITTNGTWSSEQESVIWKTTRQDRVALPTLAEATWSDPNVEEQTKRFGKVVLKGINLAKYTIWYAGLTKEEAKEWDAFIATLSPGPMLIPAITNFRFSTDPLRDPSNENLQPPSLAKTAREAILGGFKEELSQPLPANP